MRLRVTRTALRQIEDILRFVEARAPAGARAIRARLRDILAILPAHPLAGQATTRPGIRRLTLTPLPYVLFYRATPDEVVVVRVQHAARRPFAEQARGASRDRRR